jgi:hypothetical protein
VDLAADKHLIVQEPLLARAAALLDKEMLVELVLVAMVVEAVAALVPLELQTQVVQQVVLGCNGQMVPTMPVEAPEHLVDLLPVAELAAEDLVLAGRAPPTAQQIPAAVAEPTGHILTVLKQEVVAQE